MHSQVVLPLIKIAVCGFGSGQGNSVIPNVSEWKQGTTHSTHFIYGYMASDIWLRTTRIARERENLLLPHGLLFLIKSKGYFTCTVPQMGNTYHRLCYTSCGELAGMWNSWFGPPWGIDPTTHCTISRHSPMELHLIPLSEWIIIFIFYFIGFFFLIL